MTEDELNRFLEEKLYEIASVMMEYYDCCHIVDDSCKAYASNNLCCHNGSFGKGLCPFWLDNHCNNPNIGCRVWICKTAIATTDPKCVEGLKLLEQFAYLYELTKKPLIGHPYVGADRQPK